MKTAVIYTRVSSEEQVTGTSLDSQLADCLAYAQRNGLAVVNTFTDAGFSAKTANRPALKSAIEFCIRERPSAFIVWKLDRLARNTSDGLIIRATLKKAGTEVYSATEGVTQDAVGELVSTLLLSVAQFDNQQRATRCKRGMEETALRGGWCHKAPEGFARAKSPDGLPILVPTVRGEAMRVIFKDFATGRISKAEYYEQFAAIGIPAKVVAKLHTRDIYAGIVRENLTGGQPVKAAFEGLITPDELQSIRSKIEKAPRRPMESSERVERIFKGLVKCGCGRSLTPYTKKGIIYWRCGGCGKAHINTKKLLALVQKEIESADYLADLIRAAAVYARSQVKSQIEKRRKLQDAQNAEAVKAERKLDRLTDLYLDAKIDDETFARKSAELRTIVQSANSAKIDAELDINTRLTALEKTAQRLENPSSFLNSLTPAKAHTALSLIFGTFTVTPAKTLTASANSNPDSLQSLLKPTKSTSQTKKDGSKPASFSDSSLMVEVRRFELLTF